MHELKSLTAEEASEELWVVMRMAPGIGWCCIPEKGQPPKGMHLVEAMDWAGCLIASTGIPHRVQHLSSGKVINFGGDVEQHRLADTCYQAWQTCLNYRMQVLQKRPWETGQSPSQETG